MTNPEGLTVDDLLVIEAALTAYRSEATDLAERGFDQPGVEDLDDLVSRVNALIDRGNPLGSQG